MPDPVPSIVLLFEMVGLGNVLQQIPRAVTGDPPSLVIFPPQVAEVEVIVAKSIVVKTFAKSKVVNVDWSLYPVPTEFVA